MKAVALTLACALAACHGGEKKANQKSGDATADGTEYVEHTSENGPVKATVKVTPAKPLLGDPITLTLKVEAEAGVTVEMPQFGEALGRFSIVRFTPRSETTQSGGTVTSQTYVLDAPMSGKQRIPPLRVEYLDERPGQAGGDAGVAGVRDLETEEVALEVQPVLADSELDQKLRPPRGTLEARPPRSPLFWPFAVGAGVLALAGLILGIIFWRRRHRRPAEIDPYLLATARLTKLETLGVPEGAGIDAWYIELSATVREYVERRYAIRAPELTSEEFLRVARDRQVIGPEHRVLLGEFLDSCDRVKFAGHRPDATESTDALARARRFIDETRPRAEEPPEARPEATTEEADAA